MFQALSGSDTVFSFAGHEKKIALRIWMAIPELSDVLLKLAYTPSAKPENVMPIIERFVILLYDRTNTGTDINKA